MKITIDTDRDTIGGIHAAFIMLAKAAAAIPAVRSEPERLATEQRADLPKLRERVDTEATTNAAAVAAFGGGVHTPNAPDSDIPAASPLAATSYPMPTTAQAAAAAPPPPPVVAAAAPVAPPVVVAPGTALDVSGLPWDARIHAATKTKIANGTWKKKKGMDPAAVAVVETELRAVMGLPPAAPQPVAPVPPVAPVAPLVAAAPPPPPAPAAPQPPAPVVDGEILTFAQLMGFISQSIAAGKWSHAETVAACQAHQIPAVPLLATRADLIPQVVATIRAMIAAKG